jgi:cell shape-determining protein MreC
VNKLFGLVLETGEVITEQDIHTENIALKQRIAELKAENTRLKKGQEMLVHLHGILSKELFGFEALKYTGDKQPAKEQVS